MLSLFRKRKVSSAVNENGAQEKFAMRIVTACIRLQQRWATFMQRHTERLSRSGKVVALSSFCLVAGSLSTYFVANSLISRKASSFTVTRLAKSPWAGKSGDENTTTLEIVSKREYEKIQRFRLYMDSLARSSSGKRIYDSILIKRPGLLDSVFLIEEIYQSEINK